MPVVKKVVKRPAGPAVKKVVKKVAPTNTANLTPLEKARLARQNGTSGKKPAKQVNYQSNADAKAKFDAPSDFRPCFYEVTMKTEADGLLGSKITAKRIQGSYEKAPEKNRRPVHKFDPRTLMGIAARIGAATFVNKETNRLPANAVFVMVLRVAKNKDGHIRVGLKHIQGQVTKNSVSRMVMLDKKHPVYRRLRRAVKFLPAAFISAIQPPKLGRGETD